MSTPASPSIGPIVIDASFRLSSPD
jgi:hypothetical protein